MFRWFRHNKERLDSPRSEDFRGALVRLEDLLMQSNALLEQGRALSVAIDQSVLNSEVRGQRLVTQAVEALVHVRLGRSDARRGEEASFANLRLSVGEECWQTQLRQEKKGLEGRLNHLHAVVMGIERQVAKCHHDLDIAVLSRGLPRRFGRDTSGNGNSQILTDQYNVLECLLLDVRQDLLKAQALLASPVRNTDDAASSAASSALDIRSRGMLEDLKRQVRWDNSASPAMPTTGLVLKRLL